MHTPAPLCFKGVGQRLRQQATHGIGTAGRHQVGNVGWLNQAARSIVHQHPVGVAGTLRLQMAQASQNALGARGTANRCH